MRNYVPILSIIKGTNWLPKFLHTTYTISLLLSVRICWEKLFVANTLQSYELWWRVIGSGVPTLQTRIVDRFLEYKIKVLWFFGTKVPAKKTSWIREEQIKICRFDAMNTSNNIPYNCVFKHFLPVFIGSWTNKIFGFFVLGRDSIPDISRNFNRRQ